MSVAAHGLDSRWISRNPLVINDPVCGLCVYVNSLGEAVTCWTDQMKRTMQNRSVVSDDIAGCQGERAAGET